MTLQRQALASVCQELLAKYPGGGVLVAGSVQRGEERPDSDLDLFLIYDSDGEIQLLPETLHQGVKVDLAVFPERAFRRAVPAEGYKFWMFAHAEIVADPEGIAAGNQAIAISYFRDHPRIADAWRTQLAEVRRHKLDRNYPLRYPNWQDFADFLATRVAVDDLSNS